MASKIILALLSVLCSIAITYGCFGRNPGQVVLPPLPPVPPVPLPLPPTPPVFNPAIPPASDVFRAYFLNMLNNLLTAYPTLIVAGTPLYTALQALATAVAAV